MKWNKDWEVWKRKFHQDYTGDGMWAATVEYSEKWREGIKLC